jgi:hypothetical protein
MNTAVIGWGSLIWAAGDLARCGGWHSDGPALPLEFARVSRNGRLTLVIYPPAPEQRTYWLLSALDTVETARENLREREDALRVDVIRWTSRDRDPSDDIEGRVHAWLLGRAHLDAAIWTGLPPTLEGDDVVARAVGHLMGLERGSEVYQRAREYVERAPPQIQTAVRREMQARGWKDAELPADLFEP